MDDQEEDRPDLERPQKGTTPNNYKSITCLPMMWKIPKAQIGEIYDSLIGRGLFPEEQKGCRKRTREIGKLLYIDQQIFNGSKARQKNVANAWIDNKKTYDMLHQSWIIHCLKMNKISLEVIKFMEKTIETWRMELTTGGKSSAIVKIRRGIFQGDALPPSIFLIAIMPLNHILRK